MAYRNLKAIDAFLLWQGTLLTMHISTISHIRQVSTL